MSAIALVLAALAFAPADARFARETAGALVSSCTPRDGGTVASRAAARFLAGRLRDAGAPARVDLFLAATPDGPAVFSNVVSAFERDPAAPWTVFVSHFDTKPGTACPGANDGASTSGLLVALARLVARPDAAVSNNVMFVWTDGEECRRAYVPGDGFQGSGHSARRLREEGRAVRAVVCLDMLGDRDLAVSVPRNGTPALRRLVFAAARRAGLSGRVADVPFFVKDDHVPYLKEGFPAVNLIDFDYGGAPGENRWWHTPEDTMDKVSEASLLDAGRLSAELLRLLGRGVSRRAADL